jgi:dTDP-4-amino-4,6-dideoxygalactose transaminase
MIEFNRPTLIGRELDYIHDVVARAHLRGDGHYTKACNSRIAALTGAKAALLTHSCTAALEMAALLADIGPGDEVIMPSFTFVSTANAVALRGGVPVFVDIDPATLNLDPDLVAKAVTARTKAIFAVHYASIVADIDRLSATAQAHGLLLVEDAAQALGSTYKGRPAGSLGDLAAFSFHDTKNIISGEGGALTINRPDLVERAEIIREKGTNRSRFLRGQVDKYTWVDIGSSYLPSELIAAFLLAQLEEVDKVNARRLQICDRYRAAFAPFATSGRLGLPQDQPGLTGNGHMFYLLLQDIADRSAFIDHMAAKGIGTPFHYVPLHSAPAGLRLARSFQELPVTDRISDSLVRLPLHAALSDQDQDLVIDAALDYLRRNAAP